MIFLGLATMVCMCTLWLSGLYFFFRLYDIIFDLMHGPSRTTDVEEDTRVWLCWMILPAIFTCSSLYCYLGSEKEVFLWLTLLGLAILALDLVRLRSMRRRFGRGR